MWFCPSLTRPYLIVSAPVSPASWPDKLPELSEVSSWRQVSPLAGTRHQPFLSPSLRLLGNFQFLKVHTFNSLKNKGRGTCVSLEYFHSCHGGYRLIKYKDKQYGQANSYCVLFWYTADMMFPTHEWRQKFSGKKNTSVLWTFNIPSSGLS